MQTFRTKVGDLLPALRATLLDEDGNPVDLTTAVSVTFVMRDPNAELPKVERAAAFVLPRTSGVVEHEWQAGDVDVELEYEQEWVVEWPGGEPTRFPRPGFDRVIVERNLS